MKIVEIRILTALACAAALGHAGVVVPKAHDEGTSVQYRSEDGLGNYHFGYDEKHSTGGSFRKETGDSLGRKVGSYGLHDADGRVRVVTYVADEHGFRASVQTNEPGVAPEDPAATTINKAPVAVPYAAPMHFDHVTGVNVGLGTHHAAGPVIGAYSAPVGVHVHGTVAGAGAEAPVVAPVGYYRQPMHFSSVLGPSVSHMIGQMPAYIGSYLASHPAAHPLQRAVSYTVPVGVSAGHVAAGHVAAGHVATTSDAHVAYGPAVAAPVAPVHVQAPAAVGVYKAPMHFSAVVGPSVDNMLNHYLPQHLAGQKFFKSLHSPAVHHEAGPVVTPIGHLDVAPAAPVAVAAPLVAPAGPVASAAQVVLPVAGAQQVAVNKVAAYSSLPNFAPHHVVEKGVSYADAYLARRLPAPQVNYVGPVAEKAYGSSYAAAPNGYGTYAAAPLAGVAANGYASYSAAPLAGVAPNGYASYAATPLPAPISTPVAVSGPVVEKTYAAYTGPVSAAPVTPIGEKIYSHAVASPAPVGPIYSRAVYASAAPSGIADGTRYAYGPLVEKVPSSYAAAYSTPVAAQAEPVVVQKQFAYAGKAYATPYATPVSPVAKIAAPAVYAPSRAYYGSYEASPVGPIAYGVHPAAFPAGGAPYRYGPVGYATAGHSARLTGAASAYSVPVYAKAPVPAAKIQPAYSYGPLAVEATVPKPVFYAAPAFAAEPVPVAAAPVAASHIVATHGGSGHIVGAHGGAGHIVAATHEGAGHIVDAPASAGHIVAGPVHEGAHGLVSSGVSTTTAGANGYSHELVKPHAYTKVYQWMYGHAPTFYGYSYSPAPLGYRKK